MMTSATKAGLRLAGIALIAFVLASCKSEPPLPPPPPPVPPITLAPKVIEQASAYRYYITRATALTPDFADGTAIASSLTTAVAYEPKQLLQGAIAYGAVIALQDQAFVAAVRTFAANPEQRQQVTFEILRDPNYVTSIEGAASAAGLVRATLGGEGQKLYDAGKAVKQSAYDVQKQKWSKVEVANRPVRLAQAKSLSAVTLVGDVAETARLQDVALGTTRLDTVAEPATAPYSPAVVRSLAVAALAALGEGGEANVDTVMAIMADQNVGYCLNMSKLNTYQCLAVSKPHYEDIFCLGQHVMMDTAKCVIKASGMPEPYEVRFIPTVRVAEAETPSKGSGKSGGKATSKKR